MRRCRILLSAGNPRCAAESCHGTRTRQHAGNGTRSGDRDAGKTIHATALLSALGLADRHGYCLYALCAADVSAHFRHHSRASAPSQHEANFPAGAGLRSGDGADLHAARHGRRGSRLAVPGGAAKPVGADCAFGHVYCAGAVDVWHLQPATSFVRTNPSGAME
ncbi:hypothetical protein D3C80_1614580 [compost metagenome]